MTMSVKMKKVHELAREYDEKLKCTDFDPAVLVHIHHMDNTQFWFRSAFMMQFDDEELGFWIMVFTEHHDFHVFHLEDLVSFNQYSPDPTKVFPR